MEREGKGEGGKGEEDVTKEIKVKDLNGLSARIVLFSARVCLGLLTESRHTQPYRSLSSLHSIVSPWALFSPSSKKKK